MIGYACLVYLGVKMGAAAWYYILICLGVMIKSGAAVIKAAMDE